MNKMIRTTGFKIKKLREQNRLSQAELAESLSISQTTLSNIENCVTQTMDFQLMDKICKKFNVGIDYFLDNGQNNHFENNKMTSAVGYNYGTINNTPDTILEQIKLLIEDNKSKGEQIRKLQSEIDALKKKH